MPEKYTEQVTKIIEIAKDEARRLAHNFVGTEQLLLGIIREETGIAGRTLSSMGVTVEDVRDETQKIIGRGTGLVTTEIPYTPRAKKVLELAWSEANRLEDNFLDTEHLLLGFVREGEGTGCTVLENLGVDISKIRRHILTLRFEHHSRATKENPKDVKSFGCAGRALYLLERYSEAHEYLSAATNLPGGIYYAAAVDACKQHLKRR
ncbi:hypothetical protein BH11CYA1_BH11CYA1_04500 [soil metagenome]